MVEGRAGCNGEIAFVRRKILIDRNLSRKPVMCIRTTIMEEEGIRNRRENIM